MTSSSRSLVLSLGEAIPPRLRRILGRIYPFVERTWLSKRGDKSLSITFLLPHNDDLPSLLYASIACPRETPPSCPPILIPSYSARHGQVAKLGRDLFP